ncbi:MAG TPA: outer membrane protein transport protein [Holophagaceae bacterium]|nr:outer membrane protein transport protein [Holophagaceae bacterium]
MTKVLHLVVALVGGASALSAQGIQVQGSDPVTIGRGGVGVAFGRSLEAAGQNPALLVTLQEDRSAHVAFGLESQAGTQTAENNQERFWTSDRNRLLSAFGFAQRLSPSLAWGLKLDESFQRHSELRMGAPSRFQGDAISLSAHRLEGQAAWSPAGRPELSFGLGLGVTRIGLELGNTIRAGIPQDPTQPAGFSNPYSGLAEISLREEGNAISPSWTLGARWALSSRWTLGATLESPLSANVDMTGRYRPETLRVMASNGYGTPLSGTDARAYQLVGTSGVRAGNGDVKLPARFTLGLRQRQSQLLTWEVDVKWMGAGLQMPTFAALDTLSGPVGAPNRLGSNRSSLALKGMGEFTLSRAWLLRIGVGVATGYRQDGQVDPMLGGAAQSTFSVGGGYKVWGGELSAGYLYHMDRDTDRRGLEGTWDSLGYRASATKVRVEGSGHLLSLGFRRTF